ncbi:hypothetical protein GCM10027020_01140 [Nocardioides salsibiostraticola]
MTLADVSQVQTIEDYGVLGTQRTDLQEIAWLAAHIAGTAMASVNVMTANEQHMVATYGFDGASCARSDSMCTQVIGGKSAIQVADASDDPRFVMSPWVTGELGQVRLYASQTLRSPAGVAFGTLCVFDEQPGVLSESQMYGLEVLARRVVNAVELTRRERQMMASNSLLSEFASRMSHDLKAPLTSVGLSLGVLEEHLVQGAPAETTLPLVERAVAATSRMGLFIDRHLEFAERAGVLRAETVDMNHVAEQVRIDLTAALSDVRVTQEPLPRVTGDAVQLRSVLQNLLHNAAKFRHESRPPVVVIRAAPVETGWRIEVVDNGSGLDESDRDRVFGALERAHPSVEGSGLGLDTARWAVEAHRGRIGLSPAPGGGTIAWFELPHGGTANGGVGGHPA